MTESDRTSFDPRSRGGSEGRGVGDDRLSFDPSTWVRPHKAPPRRNRTMPLALAVSVALLLACALLAWSVRQDTAEATRPAANGPA